LKGDIIVSETEKPKEKIITMINKLREDLYKILQEENGTVSQEVLKLSEELDEVLNKYYNMF